MMPRDTSTVSGSERSPALTSRARLTTFSRNEAKGLLRVDSFNVLELSALKK